MREKEEEYLKKLCKRIKELRLDKGLTQEQVANAMEIDDSSYRRIESGRTNPTFKTLVCLCIALDMELKEFFNF